MHDESDKASTGRETGADDDGFDELARLARHDPLLAKRLRELQYDAYRQLQQIIDTQFASMRASGVGAQSRTETATASPTLPGMINSAKYREREAEKERALAAGMVVATLQNLHDRDWNPRRPEILPRPGVQVSLLLRLLQLQI